MATQTTLVRGTAPWHGNEIDESGKHLLKKSL